MARLTEEQVHQACSEIIERGEKPTSLVLLKELGFGSLSTITKYLKSYEEANANSIDSDLPRVVELPIELLKVSEDAAKKIWLVASEIATAELEIQRTALDTAQKEANAKVEEALAFSDAQTQKIEEMEKLNSELVDKNKKIEKHMNSLESRLIIVNTKNDELNCELNKLKKENIELNRQNAVFLFKNEKEKVNKKGIGITLDYSEEQ